MSVPPTASTSIVLAKLKSINANLSDPNTRTRGIEQFVVLKSELNTIFTNENEANNYRPKHLLVIELKPKEYGLHILKDIYIIDDSLYVLIQLISTSFIGLLDPNFDWSKSLIKKSTDLQDSEKIHKFDFTKDDIKDFNPTGITWDLTFEDFFDGGLNIEGDYVPIKLLKNQTVYFGLYTMTIIQDYNLMKKPLAFPLGFGTLSDIKPNYITVSFKAGPTKYISIYSYQLCFGENTLNISKFKESKNGKVWMDIISGIEKEIEEEEKEPKEEEEEEEKEKKEEEEEEISKRKETKEEKKLKEKAKILLAKIRELEKNWNPQKNEKLNKLLEKRGEILSELCKLQKKKTAE